MGVSAEVSTDTPAASKPAAVSKYDTGEAMCPYRLVLEHVTSRWVCSY